MKKRLYIKHLKFVHFSNLSLARRLSLSSKSRYLTLAQNYKSVSFLIIIKYSSPSCYHFWYLIVTGNPQYGSEWLKIDSLHGTAINNWKIWDRFYCVFNWIVKIRIEPRFLISEITLTLLILIYFLKVLNSSFSYALKWYRYFNAVNIRQINIKTCLQWAWFY